MNLIFVAKISAEILSVLETTYKYFAGIFSICDCIAETTMSQLPIVSVKSNMICSSWYSVMKSPLRAINLAAAPSTNNINQVAPSLALAFPVWIRVLNIDATELSIATILCPNALMIVAASCTT